MSDYVNNSALEGFFNNIDEEPDWAAEYEELMQEDFGLVSNEHPPLEQSSDRKQLPLKGMLIGYCWPQFDEQYAPCHHTVRPNHPSSMRLDERTDPASDTASAVPCGQVMVFKRAHQELLPPSSTRAQIWACDFKGCGSKSFGRRAELLRHQKKHSNGGGFPCVAQYCKRTGPRSFKRKDKLIDHMIAGHDGECLFACPNWGCAASFTPDLLALHSKEDAPATRLGAYRVCPMPKCSFKIHAWRKAMDELKTHIMSTHDTDGRKAYAGLLVNRGYKSDTLDMVCPLCSHLSEHHEAFQVHLVTAHGRISTKELDDLSLINGNLQCPSRQVQQTLSSLPLVRQHRRVILSLWPQFEAFPVWEDIKCRFEAAH